LSLLHCIYCLTLCLLIALQVGASGLRGALIGGSSSSSSPMTMDQILQVLTTKARTEAEEAQRQLIGALNGLAALLRLSGDAPGAAAAYRQGLAVSEANKQEVRQRQLLVAAFTHMITAAVCSGSAKCGCIGAGQSVLFSGTTLTCYSTDAAAL
jgi:hypothetical protein